MNWIIPLLIISTLYILVYNLAMYLFARLFGIRVEKFYVWFNPFFSIFKKKIGDTEFGLGWLPLGGYIAMSGMTVDDDFMTEIYDLRDIPEEEKILPHHYMYAAPLKRLLIVFAGPLSSLLLGIVFYAWHHDVSFPLTKILMVLGLLLAGLGTLFLIGRTQEKPHWSKEQNLLYFIITFLLYCGFFYLLLDTLNDIIPFYQIFTDMYAGKYSIRELFSTPYSSEQTILIAAFFGVFFFIVNLLPLGTLNGLGVVNALHEYWTKEKMPGKFMQKYLLISLVIVYGIWIWFFVSVF